MTFKGRRSLSAALLGMGMMTPLAQAVADQLYQPAPDEAVVYYKRADGNYEGWGLHLWDDDSRSEQQGDVAVKVSWDAPLAHSGVHPQYGAYYVVKMTRDDWKDFQFIMHNGNAKDIGGTDQVYRRSEVGQDMFTFEGVSQLFDDPHEVPPIAIEGAKAHWVSGDTILFDAGAVRSVRLFASSDADIDTDAVNKRIVGADLGVTLQSGDVSAEDAARFPHLANHTAWTLPAGLDLRELVKQQLVIATFDQHNELIAASKLQLPGVLDDLYADAAYDRPLGSFDVDGQTRYRLWAPTAQQVTLKLYDADKTLLASRPMTEDRASGIWVFDSQQSEQGRYYRYEIRVFHPVTGKVETYEVTDPYSLSLSTNSLYSQVLDLNSPRSKPQGWDEDAGGYVVEHPMDMVLYEGHVHDFSASDTQGNPAYNGKYLAFTETERDSVLHLMKLKNAGLTHLHLLPTFDIATTNEDAEQVVDLADAFDKLCALHPQLGQFERFCGQDKSVAEVLATLDPSSGDAQALYDVLRMKDSFNWGYDPFHYTVPEGGYATDPEGITRVREYRQMVDQVHRMGLNIVMDVVYNHTNASGVSDKSVLDKIVPGYYHRLDPISGAVENSTCCENTATEHRMMEKLMIDSLVIWARDYRIDAFRFDLMGHHMKLNMERALEAVRAVRPHVYFYGEGWNFGEVADGARGENAIQWNLAGTGIGTFSDRLRDAARGGWPFDEKEDLRRTQGFTNGLYWQPNELRTGDEADRADLLHKSDQIRVGMAGNLRDFVMIGKKGWPLLGEYVDYNGAPAGYAFEPQEILNYVSKHDNQTLWDNNQYRIATGTSVEDRVRMQNLALSLPMFSQSIPFFHMGSELLRSKSMERDSYDSGEWFNRVDFSYQSNNWNVGLPRFDKDGGNWPVIEQIIADQSAVAGEEEIRFASEVFQEHLRIRASSPLLRLRTGEEIRNRVDFHNTGPEQIPGLIAMSIDDGPGLADLDPTLDAMMVIVNATSEAQTLKVPTAEWFTLHPVQQQSVDERVRLAKFDNGTFHVPALTSAVFVKPQVLEQGKGLRVAGKDPSQIPTLGKSQLFLMGTATHFSEQQPAARLDYVGNGQYQVEVALDKRFHRFKLAGDDLAFGAAGTQLKVGDTVTVEADGGMMGFRVPEAGTYALTLDVSDRAQPKLSVVKR